MKKIEWNIKSSFDELLRNIFEKLEKVPLKECESPKSLDQIMFDLYLESDEKENMLFSEFKKDMFRIATSTTIEEFKIYTYNVSKELKKYIEQNVFHEYEKNDKAHGIIHIKEVIRRAFALRETYKLYDLNDDMIYAIAAYHDIGAYHGKEQHAERAAQIFLNDKNMENFFSEEQIKQISNAIGEHSSSKEIDSDNDISEYGKLVSSADRNTTIEMVFKRSFYVAQAKKERKDLSIEEYLEFTHNRLSNRYNSENPENMFYEDEVYKYFLEEMKTLLLDKEMFKSKYCEINNIKSRNDKVTDYIEVEKSYNYKNICRDIDEKCER